MNIIDLLKFMNFNAEYQRFIREITGKFLSKVNLRKHFQFMTI